MDPLATTTAQLPPTPAPAASSASVAHGKFLKVFLNATACYLLAYQLVNFLYQASMVYVARSANVPGFWNLGGVRFELGDTGWRRDMVLDVYSTGPALMLLLGGLCFLLFWRRRQQPGLGKLLLLWVALHATNTVLGGLLADTVTQSGSWYVPNWLLGAGATWPSMVLGLLFAAVQVVLGFLAAEPFLQAQDSHTIMQFDRRAHLVVYALAGPWLAGSLLLALSKLPHLGINESLHYATMSLLLIPLAMGCQREFLSERELRPRATRVAWGLVLLALLGMLAWRIALGAGVAFQ
jgi:MYXO-CTERM domain-containing protein